MVDTTQSQFLTIHDAARLIGLTSEALRARVHRGEIPSRKLSPRRILIERAALLELLRPTPAK